MSHFFRSRTFLAFLFSSISLCVSAQTIKGKVFDLGTGEPLTGATVKIARDSFSRSAYVNLDGSYTFKGLQTGTYTVTASFIGYRETKPAEVTINAARETQAPVIFLQNTSRQLTEVVVTGTGTKETDRSARGLEKN